MPSQTVGFVGLGIMGEPMARNVLDAGYPVVVHNRSRDPVDRLVEAGATAAESPAAVARQSDVVVTVLPDTPVVESVLLGDGGHEGADDPVIAGVDGETTVVDMSTISPVATERIAEELGDAGAAFLDAPISGGEEGAVEATLSIMIGGDEETVANVRDLFEVMGETVTHCGPVGAGQVTKASNQIIVGCTLQAVGEALLFAQQAGADLEAVLDAVSGGAAGCWALDARAPDVIRGDFEPGFFAEYQYKDLRIATHAGEEYGAPLPATSVVHEMYKSMEMKGYGRDDHSAVIKVLEDMVDAQARVDE